MDRIREARLVFLASSNNPGKILAFSTLTPEKEQRIRDLFKLISEEMNPEKVQVLAAELGDSLMLHAPIPKPSHRQLRIIKLVAQGLKNREIAEKLVISSKVIKNYLGNIYGKIGVRNRVELALWYEARVHEGKLRRRAARLSKLISY